MPGLILAIALIAAAPGDPPSTPAVAPAPPASARPESDSDITLRAIRSAINARRLDEAMALLAVYRTSHPDGAAAEYRLLGAELVLASGDAIGAERQIADLPSDGPFHCRLLRVRGHAALASGKADLAIDDLGALAESCEADWRDWAALGQVLADQGEADASRYAFDHAVAQSDELARVHTDFGHALIRLGAPDAAATELAIALRYDPAQAQAHLGLDMIAGMQGREPERRPGDTDELWAKRLSHAAKGALRMGRNGLAQALFAQALLISPRYDVALFEEATSR
jgi:tetratricopeptide (TPR) repeat protein